MAELQRIKVYHHTKYETLEKIINIKDVCFRGSYYEKFDKDDYEWTKECVSPIIEKICANRGYEYTKDSSFKPIIISFNQDARSDFMWTEYADEYRGVQLILDYNAIHNYAKQNLDYFNECVYIDSQKEMEKYLKGSMYKLEVICKNDYQGNLEALSSLIKRAEFKKETEIRYVHPYSLMCSITYEDFQEKGDKAFQEIIPETDDKECYIHFPKEVLLGITIGHKSADKLENVKCLLQKCGFDIAQMDINRY